MNVYNPITQLMIPVYSDTVIALLKQGYKIDTILSWSPFDPTVYNRTTFLTNDILYNVMLQSHMDQVCVLSQLDRQANQIYHNPQFWVDKIKQDGYIAIDTQEKTRQGYMTLKKITGDLDDLLDNKRVRLCMNDKKPFGGDLGRMIKKIKTRDDDVVTLTIYHTSLCYLYITFKNNGFKTTTLQIIAPTEENKKCCYNTMIHILYNHVYYIE